MCEPSQMASNVSTEGNQSSDTAVHNDSEFSSIMSNDMNLLQDARIKPERSEIEARAQWDRDRETEPDIIQLS